jgi:serine/threonine protein kinase/predicted ATPase
MRDDFIGNERFSIIKRLGAGGMGIVYEALDRERQTRVALKTLRNVDAASIYRFKVEFRSLAELSHENLLPLYELFCDDGQWFFTMELLEGATDLLSFIRGKALKQSSWRDQNEDKSGNKPDIPSEARIEDSRFAAALTSDATSLRATAFTSDATAIFASHQAAEQQVRSAAATAVFSGDSFSGDQTENQTQDRTWLGDDLLISIGDTIGTPKEACAGSMPATVPHVVALAADTPSVDYDRLRATFLQVAHGVRSLHAAGKLHRDLKPENVMVRADGRPVLLDFGLVLDLKVQAPTTTEEQRSQPVYKASTDHLISGTFAYMAPEQAAGLQLLNSSDWYAFGVMLFQVLTGRLPFTGRGIDMLRARINQDAPPPSRFAPSTPPDLNQLCIDLLNRDPSRRPGSAEILRRLSARPLVEDDGLQQYTFFVGRELYLAKLDASFAALEQGRAEVLCVHGRSGMGKTALLQHFLQGTVNARSAILLEGRCFEQESVPYKAVDNLVDALTELLMAMPVGRLQKLLPENIQALARVFPVLNRVTAIGESKNAAKVASDPLLVRQQAFEAFGKLLAAIGAECPLVLYIDDLQWGDIDSAQLLASVLAQSPAPRMLLLLSYRSEYAASPCLREFGRAWESGQLPWTELEVLPLTPEESRRLATELLVGSAVDSAQIERAVERIVEQARGSAFFVQELAENARGGVEWQASTAGNATTQLGALDEVLWKRVQRLPEEARLLIKMVAVAGQPILIGDLLHTRSLATIPQHAVKLLRTARLVRSTGGKLTDEIETFHDRVRESIAMYLAPAESRDYHQQIADALEQNAASAPETIAGHLQAVESPRASHFYELAGERAIQVLAFDRAEEYLRLAAKLAASPVDRARVETRLVHFYTDTARFQDAYNVGREAVAHFGVKLPRTFVPPLLLANMVLGLIRKGRRKPLQFLDLPEMTDERLIAVVGLISAMAKAAYQVRPEICVTICTMAVNLCLKHGNTPDAAVAYMVFGCIFLGGILGRAETGYEFGQLALALIEKYQNDKQRAEVHFVVGYFGTSWMKPSVEADRLWEIAFHEGQRTGDLFHTGCAVAGSTQGALMRGLPLDEIEARIERFWPVVEQAHLREPMACLASTRLLLSALRTPSTASASVEDPQLLAEFDRFGARHFAHFHFLNQSMFHALTGSVAAGLKASARSATYLSDSKGMLHTPEHFFWAAILQAMTPQSSGAAVKTVASARKKFAHWSKRCPANFSLRLALLAAEEARLRNRPEAALQHYQQAIQLGTQQDTLHLLGFANRRAQTMAVTLGKQEAAQAFVQAADDAYNRWGALALTTPTLLP